MNGTIMRDTYLSAVIPASLTTGIADFFRLLLRFWFILSRILAVLFRFWLILVHRITGLDTLNPFRRIRVANPFNKFSARGSQ